MGRERELWTSAPDGTRRVVDGTLLVVTDRFGRANFLGLQVVTVGGRSPPLIRNPAPTAELLIDQTQPY